MPTIPKISDVTDQAKRTTDEVSDHARKAVEEARDSVKKVADAAPGEHAISGVLRDGAYATVGAGDAIVRQVRTFGERLRSASAETPETVKKATDPEQVEQGVHELGDQAQREYEQFVARGRAVVEGISRSRTTEHAREQTKVAQSRAKAASTSVRQAAETTAEAASGAAGHVGTGPAVDTPLEDKGVLELRELAKQRDVQGRTGMNKDDLIRALRKT